MANPYDVSGKARSLEATWNFDDYVSLPHKFAHVELQDWMSNNSIPMIFAKIDTALSVIVGKNPEVEITSRKKEFDKKTKVLTALYDCSWDKGHGRQQLIKFVYSCLKYGFAIGREYHRYKTDEVEDIIGYDPDTLKHITKKSKRTVHNEAYFECLDIRKCWFDNRAKPYDEDSMRDWFWEVELDFSTFKKDFPKERYLDAEFVKPSGSARDNRDKADIQDSVAGDKVVLKFYENKEDKEFIITDGIVIIYRGILVNGELSCVTAMWRIRNEATIYGVSVCEILENDQELTDKLVNMIMNQTLLSISATGFYGGPGNITDKDMSLSPKLQKLIGAEKIVFPKIPSVDIVALKIVEMLGNDADEKSGITKSLTGELIGKTLGEAVLNKEAGLKRLSLPLQNIEFALERQARLRIDNLQRIYSKPVTSKVIIDSLGYLIDEKLWQEYLAERAQMGESPQLTQMFPQDNQTGALYRNFYKEERLPLEKTPEGETMASEQDKWMEITPSEISGEYDVKIRAFSTVPMSKALEEARAMEDFQMFFDKPYVDVYKLEKETLQARGRDPDDILMSEEQIIQQQQQAEMARSMMPPVGADGKPQPSGQPVNQPIPNEGLSQQISQALS